MVVRPRFQFAIHFGAGAKPVASKHPDQPVQELEILSLKPAGLYTYPNVLSATPQGALSKATNVVLSRPNTMDQRRGIHPVGTELTDATNSMYSFQNRLIIHHGTTFAYDSDGFFTWVDYAGSFSPPSAALKIRSFQANKNIYFNTSASLEKLDHLTGAITFSGAPAGLDGAGDTTGSGWFTSHTNVAYRIVWAFTDFNANLILGAPSQRIVVSNTTGGDTNVSLTFTIPAGITTAWQYQVYRSPMSVDLATEPNDEEALVFTGNPTSGQITAKVVTLTDNVPDSLRGEPIYTAASQQGIFQANYQAPLAVDAAVFNGFAFLGNITSKQSSNITLVSVGAPGLVATDTVTIGGTVYTADTVEVIATGHFQVFTAGTPAQNITDTANSLVRVINRYVTNTTINAFYVSSYSELPGQITLQERIIGGSSFNSSSSRAGAFVPDIGTTTLASVNQNLPNSLAVSKFSQPEAYPLGNVIPVGSGDKAILRVIALRDYLLVFKEDGVYQIVGTDLNSFEAQEVDRTLILKGIETAVALNNKVFCFSNQTVVSITYNEGAVLKALPIKGDLLKISSPLFPNFETVSYGISYESENQYILATVSSNNDTTATQNYVYNYLTDTWTTWEFPFAMSCGIVNPTDNKLYFGSSSAASRFIWQERKNYDNTDFADRTFPVTIVSSTGLIVTVASTTGLEVGWTLAQADRISKITSIPDATHLVVEDFLLWTAGAAIVAVPIPVSVRFVPDPCGNPGIVKHFKEAHTIFSLADFKSFDLGFSTDFFGDINFATLKPKFSSEAWSSGPWGDFPWGGGPASLQVIRGIVPLSQRRGHWLILSIDYADALTNFSFDGVAIFYSSMSQRFH